MKKVPKLRFPGFSGEWESKKLGELLLFKNGINASKEQYGKGVKFINVLDVLNNDYITYDNIIGKVDVDEETLEKNSVEYGDVLFQRSSETREEVGTANVYLDKEKKATFGGFIIRGKKIGEYNPIFINKLLKTSLARKEITTKSGGSTRYNVGQDILADVELLFPSLEEQQKIASFFSLIDEKIQKQQEKVEALQDYKKGIMQRIFSQEIRFKDEKGEEYPEWENCYLSDILTERKGKNIEGFLKVCSVAVRKGVIDQIEHLGRSFAAKDTSNYNVVKYGDLVYTKSPTGDFPYGIVKQSFIKEDVIVSPLYGVFKPANFYLGYILHCYFFYKENTNNYLYSIIQKGAKNTINILNSTFLTKSIRLPVSEKEQEKIASMFMLFEQKIDMEYEKLKNLIENKKSLLQQMFV